jgi:hypothetical protein
MSKWHLHLESEDESYSSFESLHDMEKNERIVLSIEGRLRTDKHLIHGVIYSYGIDNDVSLERLVSTRAESGLTLRYEPYLKSDVLEGSNILVTCHYPEWISIVESYCKDISSKFNINIDFTSQSQYNGHRQLS